MFRPISFLLIFLVNLVPVFCAAYYPLNQVLRIRLWLHVQLTLPFGKIRPSQNPRGTHCVSTQYLIYVTVPPDIYRYLL